MARVHAAQAAISREMSANKRAAGITMNVSGYAVDQDARRLMDQVPADTRSLTGILFGDPLPGRRAIDMRGRA